MTLLILPLIRKKERVETYKASDGWRRCLVVGGLLHVIVDDFNLISLNRAQPLRRIRDYVAEIERSDSTSPLKRDVKAALSPELIIIRGPFNYKRLRAV